MPELDIVFDPLPNEALSRFVSENLSLFNSARTGCSDWHPVGCFVKSPRGEWLGGVIGYIRAGWMHVDFLWVSETLRGQRYGSRLMDAAEMMAAERGATASTLETFSYHAPGFYLKRGYQEFGRLKDYPPGHSKLFLRSQLAPSPFDAAGNTARNRGIRR